MIRELTTTTTSAMPSLRAAATTGGICFSPASGYCHSYVWVQLSSIGGLVNIWEFLLPASRWLCCPPRLPYSLSLASHTTIFLSLACSSRFCVCFLYGLLSRRGGWKSDWGSRRGWGPR